MIREFYKGNPYLRTLFDDILECFDATSRRNFKVCSSKGVMVDRSKLSISSGVLLMLHNNSLGPKKEKKIDVEKNLQKVQTKQKTKKIQQ